MPGKKGPGLPLFILSYPSRVTSCHLKRSSQTWLFDSIPSPSRFSSKACVTPSTLRVRKKYTFFYLFLANHRQTNNLLCLREQTPPDLKFSYFLHSF
jgi:hypothetical protein